LGKVRMRRAREGPTTNGGGRKKPGTQGKEEEQSAFQVFNQET